MKQQPLLCSAKIVVAQQENSVAKIQSEHLKEKNSNPKEWCTPTWAHLKCRITLLLLFCAMNVPMQKQNFFNFLSWLLSPFTFFSLRIFFSCSLCALGFACAKASKSTPNIHIREENCFFSVSPSSFFSYKFKRKEVSRNVKKKSIRRRKKQQNSHTNTNIPQKQWKKA